MVTVALWHVFYAEVVHNWRFLDLTEMFECGALSVEVWTGGRKPCPSTQQGEVHQLAGLQAELLDDSERKGHPCPAREAPAASLESLPAHLEGPRNALAEREAPCGQEHLGVGAGAIAFEYEPFSQRGGHAGEPTGEMGER